MAHSELNYAITAQELPIGTDAAADAEVNVILIRERRYKWIHPSTLNPTERVIRAVEITWSPETRWIKNSLLGYDATAITPIPFGSGGPTIDLCSDDKASDPLGNRTPDLAGFRPPSRLAVNGLLKWGLLDRTLADALIYSGSYGVAMQRGMAQALCRIAGGTSDGVAMCRWPDHPETLKSHYVFITHSLGSRLLYDTMLNLSGSTLQAEKYPNLFPPAYVRSATPTIREIVNQTAGFYMMANQLTMIGLADVPSSAQFNRQSNYLQNVPSLNVPGLNSVPGKAVGNIIEGPDLAIGQGQAVQRDPLIRLVSGRSTKNPLEIISFNDTNDLLTWHIPKWYTINNHDGATTIEAADVFVKNATRWLWTFELPNSAHDEYFSNSDVWEVMFCGASEGYPKKCLN